MKSVHIQVQQFITLLILLVAGKYLGYLYLEWPEIFMLITATAAMEHLLIFMKKGSVDFFSFSALSTSVGIVLMLASTHFYLYFIVLFLGLFQKHFLQYEGIHFFNPSNFSLILGLLFFYESMHIVTGQLGESLWVHMAALVLAAWILFRVDRWIIPVGFAFFYLLLEYWCVVSYDPVMIFENIYERFYSVSFLVFTLFMLTDPRTTPSKSWLQLLFALFIAGIATALDRYNGFRVQHLFMALFVLSPLVPLVSEHVKKREVFFYATALFFLALGAIIYIELQPPYYFEMEG
jgi:hypothetical protein